MDLVCIVGFAGSGKDTVGLQFIKHGFTKFAFADGIKDCLSVMFSWDREMLEGRTEESRIWRETPDAWWSDRLNWPNFTPRVAMTSFGTIVRMNINDGIWCLNTERRIDQHDGPVVVTDGRFKHELRMVKSRGGKIIRVKRGNAPDWYELAKYVNLNPHDIKAISEMTALAHYSEWDWIGTEVDFNIDNYGDIADLNRKVRQIICS